MLLAILLVSALGSVLGKQLTELLWQSQLIDGLVVSMSVLPEISMCAPNQKKDLFFICCVISVQNHLCLILTYLLLRETEEKFLKSTLALALHCFLEDDGPS